MILCRRVVDIYTKKTVENLRKNNRADLTARCGSVGGFPVMADLPA